MNKNNHAFTLIELLVAIFIIAVVIGLLFPVLSMIREKSKQAVCMSNMGQMFKCFAQYAIENDGHSDHLVSWTHEDSSALNYGPITLKKDEYFLLGDNRDNSRDSRHFGPVKRNKIHGKLIHIFNTGSRVKGE